MNVLIWGWMLCKRLWKKATFLLILGLIPLLVFGFGILAEEQSGFVTVVLAAEDASDPLANSMTDRLLQERGLMRFVSCNSPAEAEALVRNGTVDGAWIFPADLQKRVEDFFDSSYRRKPLAVVMERESTVPLRLAREKLSGILFECCSQQMFLDSVRAHSPEAQEWSDEALLEFYRNAFTPASHLFDFSLVGGGTPAEGETNYLMSPLRGLLAVVIVLAGFATAMYYMQDHRIGLFSWVSCRRLPYVELGVSDGVGVDRRDRLSFGADVLGAWRTASSGNFGFTPLCGLCFGLFLFDEGSLPQYDRAWCGNASCGGSDDCFVPRILRVDGSLFCESVASAHVLHQRSLQ